MFEVKATLINLETGESFIKNDDVKITFENGSVLFGFIDEADLSYNQIELNVPFVEGIIQIRTDEIQTITKIE